MVAPFEAPVDSVGLAALPVGYPIDGFAAEVTPPDTETDRHNEAVFLNEHEVVANAATGVGLASCTEMTAAVTGLRRSHEAQEAVDTRPTSSNVEFVDGRLMRIVSFFDGAPGRTELTDKILDGRRRQYIAHGLVEPTIKQDPVRGDNIEFVAVVDPEPNDPATSFRKIHMTEEGLKSLPSYGRFVREGGFSEEGLSRLEELAKARKVVEIAGLWKDPAYSPDTKFALYKDALQRSIERDEVWFMGIVAPEYRHLRQTYGDVVVQTIGQPVNIHEEHIPPKVRLRPVIIDPHDFYDTLISEVEAAQLAGDEETRRNKEVLVWHFLDGLDLKHLSETTLQRLENMTHGRITR